MATAFDRAHDVLWKNQDITVEVIFQQTDAPPKCIRAVPVNLDTEIEGRRTSAMRVEGVFDVLVSEVPFPQRDDQITYKDKTYTYSNRPIHPDPERRLWRYGEREGT